MISGHIIGSEVVRANLLGATPRIREAMRTAIAQAALLVSNRAKNHYLTGAALHVRTGNLRRSVIPEKVVDDGQTISAVVGTNSVYGRFWERGFQGTVTVRAHVRSMSSRSQYRAHGKARGKLDASGVGFVRSHQRKISQAPRPFLAPALEDCRTEIRLRILRGLTRALKSGSGGGR